MPQKVAVVGAGVAGLACARVLRRAGCYVDLFEKDSGVGGRLAAMRLGLTQFDHGAQYLTARNPAFRDYMQELVTTGYAKVWEPRIAVTGDEGSGGLLPWYVGTPSMASLVRPLAESVQVFTNREVHTISRENKSWTVWFTDESYRGPYAAVAITAPAPDAKLLLGPVDELAEMVSKARLAPCWSLMVKLDEPILPRFDVYSDMSQIIRWISKNNSKPGRNARGEHVVVHASQSWSRETEDAEPDLVAEELWAEVCHLLDLPPNRPSQMQAYLWRNGLVDQPVGETYLYSSAASVGCAGDWCSGRLAEHAFISGTRLGRAIVQDLN